MAKKHSDAEAAATYAASKRAPARKLPGGRSVPAVQPGPSGQSAFSRHRVTSLAKRQMNLLHSLETKVLRGEKPRAIHDLRVASRRLQEILDLLYPKPRSSKLRKIRSTLRRARRSLSAVRNCDVLLKQVEQNLGRKRLAHREVWTTFRDYLREQRDNQMRRASRKLGKLNLTAWYVHVKAALAPVREPAPKPAPNPKGVARIPGQAPDGTPTGTPTGTGPSPQESHRPELRELAAESLLQSWEALNERVAQSQKEPAAKTIHAVRIAAKKLRYLIEVMQVLGVAGSESTLDWLRQLQRHLGDWHDLEVMEQTMIEMLARPEFLIGQLELAVETEKLMLRHRRVKNDYQDRFFELIQQRTGWERLAAWIHSSTESGEAVETKAG